MPAMAPPLRPLFVFEPPLAPAVDATPVAVADDERANPHMVCRSTWLQQTSGDEMPQNEHSSVVQLP